MPRHLQRLRSGIIVSADFLAWLERTLDDEAPRHPGKEPVFECLRFHPDSRPDGREPFWWQIEWRPAAALAGVLAEPLAGRTLWFTRAARHTLRDRCLDLHDGQPCLR